MADSNIIEPGTRLGPCEILDLLDSGGMGEVYRAHDPRLRRNVAIKVLRDVVVNRLERFEAEARAASALGHPNILVVYDFGRHGEVPYLVSELLEGRTLRDYLLEAGGLPPRK
jgi:serine/threonine protein kinase